VVVVRVVGVELGVAERALVRGGDASKLAEAASAAEGFEAKHHVRVCAMISEGAQDEIKKTQGVSRFGFTRGVNPQPAQQKIWRPSIICVSAEEKRVRVNPD